MPDTGKDCVLMGAIFIKKPVAAWWIMLLCNKDILNRGFSDYSHKNHELSLDENVMATCDKWVEACQITTGTLSDRLNSVSRRNVW